MGLSSLKNTAESSQTKVFPNYVWNSLIAEREACEAGSEKGGSSGISAPCSPAGEARPPTVATTLHPQAWAGGDSGKSLGIAWFFLLGIFLEVLILYMKTSSCFAYWEKKKEFVTSYF